MTVLNQAGPDGVAGPGPITTEDVGCYTIAKTTLVDTRLAMAYAAGINDRNPRYFDDLAADGVRVHPCLAFSLQWNSRVRPDYPVNLRAAPYGVHATTDLRIHRPFRAGEAVTTQGCVIAKKQISPGVYTVDKYQMRGSDGDLIAELYYNGITRGAQLVGGDCELEAEPAWPEVMAQNAQSPDPLWRDEYPIELHAGQQYTECARIYNPIHTEPSVAIKAGLPNMILHGSATKAISLSAVVDRCFDGDANRITRLCGQLRGMVLMDSVVSVEALAETVVDGEKRVQFRTLNQSGQTAINNGIVCGRA